MPTVLYEWIQEGVLAAIESLCPLPSIGTSIYPTAIVLGLDNKHAVFGDENVVYLSGLVIYLESDIVDIDIIIRVQRESQCSTEPKLTDQAPYRRPTK
jgi:hypothetical protein